MCRQPIALSVGCDALFAQENTPKRLANDDELNGPNKSSQTEK